MSHWFYFDANGKKHGAYDLPKLQKFARLGYVKPSTPMESIHGDRTVAGELDGLLFPDWKRQIVPAFCSLLCPGMGHLVQGRLAKALSIFIFAFLCVGLTSFTIGGYFLYFLLMFGAALDVETWIPELEKASWNPKFLLKVKKPWLLTGMGIAGFCMTAFMLFSSYSAYSTYNANAMTRHFQEQSRQANMARTALSDTGATQYAEEAVKKFLKYPLDAKFNWDKKAEKQDPTTPSAPPTWVVTGTVKAPNGFGAFLTHSYRVVLTGTDEKCSTVSVEIDRERVYP